MANKERLTQTLIDLIRIDSPTGEEDNIDSEVSRRLTNLGFIVADNLQPQKARILLMLGLTITDDRDILQKLFLEY